MTKGGSDRTTAATAATASAASGIAGAGANPASHPVLPKLHTTKHVRRRPSPKRQLSGLGVATRPANHHPPQHTSLAGGRSKETDASPSPIAYSVTYNNIGANEHAGFTLTGRFPVHSPETPSPQAYTPPIQLGDGAPQWSIAGKLPLLGDNFPGPSQYDPQLLKVKFPYAAAYSMRPKLGPPLFFSKEVGPGYNEYNPQLPSSQVATTMKGRPKESKVLKTPGPANYIINTSITSGPQYSMAGREEEDDDEETLAHLASPVPGPTAYSPIVEASAPASPRYSLGAKREAKQHTTISPGPGAYLPQQMTIQGNHAQKASIKGRPTPKTNVSPGPGDYNSGATYSIDSIVRTAITRRTAAKAARKAMQAVTAAIKHTAEHGGASDGAKPEQEGTKHAASSSPHSTPGPADYSAHNVGSRASPKYSMTARHAMGKDLEHGVSPGPSSYSPHLATSGPHGVSMKSRPSDAVLIFPSLRLANS